MFKLVLPVLVAVVLAAGPRNKKKDELPNQVLQLPRELPSAVVADTHRLIFLVAPPSSHGLLSQQVRDGLKALLRMAGGGAIVRLRAFVAGTGDMRRVQTIVGETFTDRRLTLPALSVVQVGGLPAEGVQVSLEAVVAGKKDVNPNGLVMVAGQTVPLAALKAAGVEKTDVLRATCYLSALDDIAAVRARVAAEYPQAALNFVQLQREPSGSVVECEAVARLRTAPASAVERRHPEKMVLVTAPRLAFSSAQMAFGYQDNDARLAFRRLDKALHQVHTSLGQVVMSNFYPLTGSIAEMIRRVRFEFYNPRTPPPATLLEFQGLPSLDASFAVDVIATVDQ